MLTALMCMCVCVICIYIYIYIAYINIFVLYILYNSVWFVSSHRKELGANVDPYDWDLYQLARTIFASNLRAHGLL